MRKPHPSFWLGGGGEKVTLKIAAEYAQYTNFAGAPDAVISPPRSPARFRNRVTS